MYFLHKSAIQLVIKQMEQKLILTSIKRLVLQFKKVCTWAKWPTPPELIPGYPPTFQQFFFWLYPFILLGAERHWESKVSCPRTQRIYNDLVRAQTRNFQPRVQCANHYATASQSSQVDLLAKSEMLDSVAVLFWGRRRHPGRGVWGHAPPENF